VASSSASWSRMRRSLRNQTSVVWGTGRGGVGERTDGRVRDCGRRKTAAAVFQSIRYSLFATRPPPSPRGRDRGVCYGGSARCSTSRAPSRLPIFCATRIRGCTRDRFSWGGCYCDAPRWTRKEVARIPIALLNETAWHGVPARRGFLQERQDRPIFSNSSRRIRGQCRRQTGLAGTEAPPPSFSQPTYQSTGL